MLIKYAILIIISFSAGMAVSAATFAAIATIGIIPRMAGRSKTAGYIKYYETATTLGVIWGNVVNIYNLPIIGGQLINSLFGFSAGIFVGCLAMALAERLNTIPVFFRRAGLVNGCEYIVIAMALGKLCGALTYFFNGW